MKRGPQARAEGGRPGAYFAQKALAAFLENNTGDLPDWLAELARLADRDGLKMLGKRIGYSSSALSFVISGSYTGDLARVEARVRGALMGETVLCPVMGETPRDQCLDWQKKPFAATSSRRVAVYRACRSGCPHSALKGVSTGVEEGVKT